MESVLIGYEPTHQGEDALALGGIFSETLSARPSIITVLPFSSMAMGRKNLEISLSVDTAEMLAMARDRLSALSPISRAIASHSPAKGLAELAADREVAMTVVGSSHRGTIGHVFLGSTAVRLLHDSPVPVAIAPRGFAETGGSRLLRIAVAYDGSTESRHALETGIALAEHTRASLTLIHVIKPPVTGYGLMVETIEEGDTERAQGNRILGEARELVPDAVPVGERLLHGPPAEILAEATEDFDMLVLGSRGHGSLLGTALGSVSGPLVRQAPCPVLVIPRGGAERGFAAPTLAAARRS